MRTDYEGKDISFRRYLEEHGFELSRVGEDTIFDKRQTLFIQIFIFHFFFRDKIRVQIAIYYNLFINIIK